VSPQKKRTRRKKAPRCIIIAGPNGAGKTTFAQEFLPKYAKVVHFVNSDLIASGLSAPAGTRGNQGGPPSLERDRPTRSHRRGLCI
jgi:adenylylsulfate kinase-like enzyme